MTDGIVIVPGRIDPPQITASTNNYAPTGLGNSTVIYVDGDANRNITGIDAKAFASGANQANRQLTWVNDGAFDFNFIGLSGGSDSDNQFAVSSTIEPGEAITWIYDGTATKWRVLAITAAAGGGTPGGSDTEIQYNNAGAFGGSSAFTVDAANSQMVVTHLKIGGKLSIAGDASHSVTTTPQNDYTAGGALSTLGILNLNVSTTDITFTGFAAPSSPYNDGRALLVRNTGSVRATLSNLDSGSSSANQFSFGATIALEPGDGAILVYDLTNTKWRCHGRATLDLIGARIISDGTFHGFRDQNGNELLQVAGTASAVNHWALTAGATGTGPSFSPGTGGTDSNVSPTITGRGTGFPLIGVSGKGVGIAGKDTANPTTGQEGAIHYRSDLDEWFFYEATRAKWLSLTRETWLFSGSVNTLAAGTGLRISVGIVSDNGDNNYLIPYACTLVGYAYVRVDTDSSVFEVMANASTVKLTINTSANAGKSMASDVDFAADDRLWLRVGSGASNAMDFRTMKLFFRQKAT